MSKTVQSLNLTGPELTGAAISAAVAEKREDTIERWGSIIYWGTLRYVPEKTPRWRVTVKCGLCGGLRPAAVYDTKPQNGMLTADSLRCPQSDYTRFGYTGLCRACHKRINKANTIYPDGTTLFHQERTKDGLPVHCGACKRKGFLHCSLSETLHDKHWPCPSCGEVLGKWLHEESGATVYWLRRKEGQRNYVAFGCAKCGDEFYCKDELPKRPVWIGMCPNCWQKEHPRAIKTTKPLPGSSKGIEFKKRFGEGKPKRGRKNKLWGRNVTLPCPIPGCSKENDFHFESTRREGFLPLCKSGKGKKGHTLNEIASFLLIQPQNNNKIKGGESKKGGKSKIGRPPAFSDAEAYQAIDALGSRLSVSQLSKALKCSRPTIDNWVERNDCSSLSELVEKRRAAG